MAVWGGRGSSVVILHYISHLLQNLDGWKKWFVRLQVNQGSCVTLMHAVEFTTVCASLTYAIWTWAHFSSLSKLLTSKLEFDHEDKEYFTYSKWFNCQSQWPCSLRRVSTAFRLLGLRVRISSGAWMFVSCEWCVLSDRSLCDGLTTHPEKSYSLCCVWVWSWSLDNEEALAHYSLFLQEKKKLINFSILPYDIADLSEQSYYWLLQD